MNIVNERDENGRVIIAALKFDYIENKAIEEEHRKGQLLKLLIEAQVLSTFAATKKSGDKKIILSLDGTTCKIEIYNVPYCSFCQKPYHIESGCFKKNL